MSEYMSVVRYIVKSAKSLFNSGNMLYICHSLFIIAEPFPKTEVLEKPLV